MSSFYYPVMNIDPKIDDLSLKRKYRNEVAKEYGISIRTLNRWFERENINIPRGFIDPAHLRLIYKTFGIPQRPK